MKRKLIHYAASFIHNSGLLILPGESQICISHVLLVALFNYSSVIIFAGSYAIINRDDFTKFINPIPYLAIVSITLGGFFSIFYHKGPLSELFFQMDGNMYTYPDEDQLQIICDKWYLQEDKIVVVLKTIQSSYFIAMLVRSFPTFVYFFVTDSTEAFLYPGWMPWPMDVRYWHWFTLFFQLIQGACGIWCFNLVLLSIMTPVFEFCNQYKRLEEAVRSISSRARMISEGNKRKFQRLIRENIVHCIKHHQILNKNFQLYKIWMEIILSSNLFICMVSLAFGLYIAVNASNFLKMYNCYEIIGVVIMNLLAVCIFSEIFLSLNESLACTLFWETDWLEMGEKNKKLLIIFHQMSLRPFELFAFTIFPANRVTFSKIMRATYSIYNVLNVSIQK